MWGRKKEEEFIPTHVYLKEWPVRLTGFCTESTAEGYRMWGGNWTKQWLLKEYLEPIYEYPEYVKS